MAGGGPGGLLGVAALVDPCVDRQAVAPAGRRHKLPHADGPGPAPGPGIEAALRHGEVLEFLGDALLREDVVDHGAVDLDPTQPAVDVAVLSVLQVRDALVHEPIRGHRHLGVGDARVLYRRGRLQQRVLNLVEGGEELGAHREDLPAGHLEGIRVRAVAVEAAVLTREAAVELPDGVVLEGVGLLAQDARQLRHCLVEQLGGAGTVLRREQLGLQGVEARHLGAKLGAVVGGHQHRIRRHGRRFRLGGEKRRDGPAAGDDKQDEQGAEADQRTTCNGESRSRVQHGGRSVDGEKSVGGGGGGPESGRGGPRSGRPGG